MLYRAALPGMAAHINADGTIVGTNATLHTSNRVWHNLTLGHSHSSIFFLMKEFFEHNPPL
jgi:hypothetical protein